MNAPRLVPVLPETAPFTPEQRAYLNGFLAGLFSHAPVSAPATPPSAPPAPALIPVTILFGSQTGGAERFARRLAREATRRGFAPVVSDLASYPTSQLAGESNLLVVTSTYGDGEPPDHARAFWSWLQGPATPRLTQLRFSVCALGDRNYPRFCQFGVDLDARLAALGARRAHPRQDCDVDGERSFLQWLAGALAALSDRPTPSSPPNAASPADAGPDRLASADRPDTSANPLDPDDAESRGWSKANPFPARLLVNRRLSAPGSERDVRHFEIELADSGITYEVGDALGVWPTHHPDLVEATLAALGADGEEAVPGRDDRIVPLRLALLGHYEIGRLTPEFLRHFADRTRDPALARLVSPDGQGELQAFLRGRDILDLLRAHPSARPAPADLPSLLRKLQPRLYSIASSRKAHPREVHLTVGAVRFETLGRARQGVASCFLADRCAPDTPLPIFLHANPSFRPPPPETDAIMIGPGTGIAPFRAFLQERRATGATGRNWLFFGGQHAATDYLYREELEEFVSDGLLHRLDLAWSRDQAEKIYVQHRLLAAAAELWRWIEGGAAVFVCGDASRMARDVDQALAQALGQAGRLDPEAARACLVRLQAERRYLRDVY